MANPKFSIIVPAYNRADCLRNAVQSVLAQTDGDWELIIVDDASTDETLKVAKECAAGDERIQVLALSKNHGAAGARNKGIVLSRGEFVVFLDSDDRLEPALLERAASSFVDSDVGLVCGWGHGKDRQITNQFDEYMPADINNPDVYLSSNPCFLTGTAVQTSVLKKVGSFDENMICSEDWDLWIRILRVARGAVLDEFLFSFERSANSLTRNVSGQDIIAAGDRTIAKQRDLYDAHRRALALRYRHEGSFCINAGGMRQARQRFVSSILVQPRMLGTWVRLLASLFGCRVYLFLVSLF